MAALIGKCSAFLILVLASAAAQNRPGQKPPDPVPIPQMAPEELPAKPPRVSYGGGQLIIDADNSSLAEVLSAIARETGAQVDQPANSDAERVVAHLSGPPHRVLAELLDGGKFGYIILSPLQDPAGIQRVIVTRESQNETRPGAMAAPVGNRAVATPPAELGPTPEYRRAEGAEPDAEKVVAAPVQPASQPQQAEAPQQAATSADEPARAIFSGSDPLRSADPAQNPGPAMLREGKSPMDVLQNLYRMRQQQVQQQNQPQQQPPKPQ